MTSGASAASIEAAIARVQDPCSIAANAPLNVADMGLIRGWEADEAGNVRIHISPTYPSCIMLGHIAEQIEREVGAVPGVSSVRVEHRPDFMWTPEDMTAHGRAWLDERRTTSRRLVPIEPIGAVHRAC